EAAADSVGRGNHADGGLYRGSVVGIDFDIDGEHFLIAAAQHGEGAMAGGCGPAFGVVEIVGEFGAGFLLAVDHLGAERGAVLHIGAQAADEVGVFGHLFHNDVAGAVEGGFYIRDIVVEIGGGEVGGDEAAVIEDRFS